MLREAQLARLDADNARVQRRETYSRTTPTIAQSRCFSCHRAWAGVGVPAVVRTSEGDTATWSCRCCGAYRVLTLSTGRVETTGGRA